MALEEAGAGGGGRLSHDVGVLAEVGPATLTADPRLFQQRLRELHVQVRRPQPRGTAPRLALGAW